MKALHGFMLEGIPLDNMDKLVLKRPEVDKQIGFSLALYFILL